LLSSQRQQSATDVVAPPGAGGVALAVAANRELPAARNRIGGPGGGFAESPGKPFPAVIRLPAPGPRGRPACRATARRAGPTVAGVIAVVDYDPAWPERFERLRREYAGALDAAGVPVIAIEHVGSTAVPGLAAKPVVDCDIVVAAEHVTAASRVLARLGFRPLGELGIPQRYAFAEPRRLARTNTYVVVDDALSLRNHLAVRDTLRHNDELRDQYATVKRRAAAEAAGIEEYGRLKEAMVQRILAAAGLTEAERASIAANQVPPRDEVPR